MLQGVSNKICPFEFMHHASMLADSVRLDAFRQAIFSQIGKDDCVVDIGTGTGILASYAATKTRGKVYGLEYFKATAECARELFKNSSIQNVEIVNKKSYNRPIDARVDTLITETIGTVGPEENIVELCYEFCQRYPEIKTIIPSKLTIYAQPVYSKTIESKYEKLINSFRNASHSDFNYDILTGDIELAYSSLIHACKVDDARFYDSPIELISYDLGKTKRSDFSTLVQIPAENTANALHLYFVADLGNDIRLSSRIGSPYTHWEHSFIHKSNESNKCEISFSSNSRKFSIKWV